MYRRRFLTLATGSTPFIAGCSSQNNQPTATGLSSPTETATATSVGSPSPKESRTDTQESSSSPAKAANTHFVDPAGDDGNPGTESQPLASIQRAIHRAKPGDSIQVASGEYRELLITKRPGEPGDPITITGPSDAIVRPPKDNTKSRIFAIVHSHIHLHGMTFDGLAIPDTPEDPASYAVNIIDTIIPTWEDDFPDYLTDIKIKPDAIGNAKRHVLGTTRTNNVEIGEFRIIGPAGTENLYDDDAKEHPSGGLVAENHIGEVIQIGVKHNTFDEGEGDWYTEHWDTPDESHDIHVHHIDNSEGHPHTELIELGTSVYDATIEYCTDAGGAGMYFLSTDHENWTETSMGLRGGRCTLRWCVIENGYGSGVQIGTPPGFDRNREKYQDIPDSRYPGTHNSVYGNRIVDNAGLALAFPYELYDGDVVSMGPDDQDVICGNEINGDTQGSPGKTCSVDIPMSDGIGHLAGDSPWA